MLYKEDFERVKERYREFWAMENHDRPIVQIAAPKDKTKAQPSYPGGIKDRWLDTEFMLKNANAAFQNTYFGGEAFPMLWPNLGPDVFAAFFGASLQFAETTSWAQHNMGDISDCAGIKLLKDGFYYKKMLEMTAAAVEDGRDKYIVGITDLHTGADALAALRGPQNLCLDVVDDPQSVKKGIMALYKGFCEVFEDLYALCSKYQEGSANWMRIWHPGRWYVTSCDFCCMVSSGMFEDLIAEELLLELDFLDASIFHLDGPGALTHVDRLLQMPKLKGIQWVYGAGQPTASHWIPLLKKIQAAGKCIQITVYPDELDIMLESLKPEGVMFIMSAESEEDARALLKRVEGFKRNRSVSFG